MNRHRPILITMILCLLYGAQAGAQCSVSSYWIGAPITAGTLNATGVVPGNDTITVRHSGFFASGRPNWWGANYTYLGKNYSSLWISRGSSFGTGNRSSFKLKIPLDSNRMHVRVSDIRGDGFNAESQRVQGWMNGVSVPATFTDAVNGAFISGGNIINGASTTSSTVQSAMRVHFNGNVDSITVTATNLSDYVIVELMVACDLLLPDEGVQLRGRISPEGNLLWCDASLNNYRDLTLQRSSDGQVWADLRSTGPTSSWRFMDPSLSPGRLFYRLRMTKPDGWTSYSNQVALGRWMSEQAWSCHPNPCRDILILDGPALPIGVECFSTDGRSLRSWHPTAAEPGLNTTGLPSGLLFFRAMHHDGSATMFRILHQ